MDPFHQVLQLQKNLFGDSLGHRRRSRSVFCCSSCISHLTSHSFSLKRPLCQCGLWVLWTLGRLRMSPTFTDMEFRHSWSIVLQPWLLPLWRFSVPPKTVVVERLPCDDLKCGSKKIQHVRFESESHCGMLIREAQGNSVFLLCLHITHCFVSSKGPVAHIACRFAHP